MAAPIQIDPTKKLPSADYVRTVILGYSYKSDLDPAAVEAVAMTEGGFDPSAPGHFDPDQHGNPGWSYGPFQMRSPGGLPITSSGPQGPGENFAWSPQGIAYAVHQIEGVAAGKQGQDAINSIVKEFEKPANIPGEEARAATYYKELTAGGSGVTPNVPNPPAIHINIPGLGNLPIDSGSVSVTDKSGTTTTTDTGGTQTGIFNWLGNPVRILQLVLGGAMLLLGLFLLARNSGVSPV